MTDLLLELSKNPRARGLVRTLGLPLPMPTDLRRGRGATRARPLEDMRVLVRPARFELELADTLASAGAETLLEEANVSFASAGEAYARPSRALKTAGKDKIDAIVFDASFVSTVSELGAVYEFFHAHVKKLGRTSRVVVLGLEVDPDSPSAAAAQGALDGFCRSLAKELGRHGTTVNLLRVSAGAESSIKPTLRFFLSARSAFITGQPIALTRPSANPAFTRPLEGKVALVTGGARGIGKATATRLSEEGATVIVLDRPADDEAASKTAREIGGEVLLVDVTDDDAPKEIRAALLARHGGVDIVVHNAGVTRDKTIAKMSRAQWDMTLDVNLHAVTKINAALMAKCMRDNGRVVLLSSVAGIAGNMGQTNYASAKSGLIHYTRASAAALDKRGITINAIAPGFIETRMTAAMPAMIREGARRLSALGQGGQPVDVAEAITFLATPGASGISGQLLRVCGGALVGA